MKRLTLSLSCLLLCFLCASAQGNAPDSIGKGIKFHQNESWEKILELAKKEDKMIFMDCYTTWCGPCKALSKEVFPQQKVGDFFNPRFINVQYDMEKGDGKMLNNKYKQYIIGYPTLLLIDKEGKVVQQMAGYQDADKLIEGMRQASEGNDLFSLQKRYEQGERDFEFIKTYMTALEGAYLKDTIAKVATEYFNNNKPEELDKDDVWNTFGTYVTDIYTPTFEYLAQNLNKYYYRLHRDRYKITRQLENAIKKEVRRITAIDFEKDGSPKPLISDSVASKRILSLISSADMNSANETKAKLFIHNLLVENDITGAWKYIKACADMDLTGFHSAVVNNYIRYMATQTNDKKMLRDFLQTLNTYEQKEKDSNFFTYSMYRTMANLNQKLGNKELAKTQMEEYERIDKEKTKEFEDIFSK